jgi:hypothetical protein
MEKSHQFSQRPGRIFIDDLPWQSRSVSQSTVTEVFAKFFCCFLSPPSPSRLSSNFLLVTREHSFSGSDHEVISHREVNIHLTKPTKWGR